MYVLPALPCCDTQTAEQHYIGGLVLYAELVRLTETPLLILQWGGVKVRNFT